MTGAPGDGRYRYVPGFLSAEDAAAVFDELMAVVPWRRERLWLFGRQVQVPRLLAWYGDTGLNYRYSGADHVCDGWLPALAALRDRLRAEQGLASNLVLVNRYRHGEDYMGWHRDDERGLGRCIASVSLGGRRRFLLRPEDGQPSVALDLAPGSLLIMDASLRHSLPKTRKPVPERINLTFRRLAAPGR